MNTKSFCLFLAVAVALTGWAADELVVSANTTLTENTSCSSIRFTGGYSLSAADGVKVTVEAGGGITVASGAATVSCPVQFGSTTDGAFEHPLARLVRHDPPFRRHGPYE